VGDIVGISFRPGRKPKFLLGAEDTEGADEMEGEGEGARVG